MSVERDQFRIDGDCWCPGEMTLAAVRVSGHTADCTQGRKGWELNRRHMTEIARQRRADEAAGRQLREAATEFLRREAALPEEPDPAPETREETEAS